MSTQTQDTDDAGNVDAAEIAKFDDLARRWWDPKGDSGALHEINPLRLNYIDRHAPLDGARVADIGCGGGILSEAMARRGATVTGIDLASSVLEVAREHAHAAGVEVDYRQVTAEALAEELPGQFDTVTCMEMLEHVPDPGSVVNACARLLRPGGHAFFATINRNPRAYLFAVIGAEYVLRLLPRGTHDYRKFIKPSELDASARRAGLTLEHMTGLQYNPITRAFSLGRDVAVNYMMCCRRAESAG